MAVTCFCPAQALRLKFASFLNDTPDVLPCPCHVAMSSTVYLDHFFRSSEVKGKFTVELGQWKGQVRAKLTHGKGTNRIIHCRIVLG